MKEKIEQIATIIDSTWKLYSALDQSAPQAYYVHIPKQDKVIINGLYKSYDMKRFAFSYGAFEGLVIKTAIDNDILPVDAALEICKKSNEELNGTE